MASRVQGSTSPKSFKSSKAISWRIRFQAVNILLFRRDLSCYVSAYYSIGIVRVQSKMVDGVQDGTTTITKFVRHEVMNLGYVIDLMIPVTDCLAQLRLGASSEPTTYPGLLINYTLSLGLPYTMAQAGIKSLCSLLLLRCCTIHKLFNCSCNLAVLRPGSRISYDHSLMCFVG